MICSFRTVGDSLNEYILPSLNLTAFTKNRINFPFCFTYTIYFSEHVRLCQNNTSRKIWETFFSQNIPVPGGFFCLLIAKQNIQKLMRTVLCSLYKQHLNTKLEASPLPDKSRSTSRIYRDYYMAFFISYPLSTRGHDISRRADRLKGWYKNERGLIMGYSSIKCI
jgi:hypothetical protein